MYSISKYTKDKAKELGVVVFSAEKYPYKLEIYNKKDGVFIGYIGDRNYADYPTYLAGEKQGLYPSGYADERRRLYHIRHNKDMSKVGSKGYYAGNLLW